MTEHAKLSASGSDRWLNCTRSSAFESQFPEQPNTKFSEEGTFAHAVAERALAKYLGLRQEPLPQELQHYDSSVLREAVQVYVDFAIERIIEARQRNTDAAIMLEKRLDFSAFVPSGFGTGDLVTVSDGLIDVNDLKFGKGILVDAQGNSQLRLYGLGALTMFEHLFDVKTVRMTIVQPRLNHISTEELSTQELRQWGEQFVKPKAQLAWAGEGDFNPGEHCRWCRGKAVCSARAQASIDLARFDFAAPESMDDEAISHVLEKAAMLHAWVADIEAYAFAQALKGRRWDGFKLVQGRSLRKFGDEEAVVAALIDAGVESELLYERSLRSLTDLEKKIGKNMFARILGDLVVKSPGKPQLVSFIDKRPEYQPPAADPAADFTLS